jgi:hypothetical protein
MGMSSPHDSVGSHNSNEENGAAKDEIVVFLGEFGSYLKLDTCLAYASALKFEAVVDLLLSIAKYDPRHKEVIKHTSKSIGMVFYEPVRHFRSFIENNHSPCIHHRRCFQLFFSYFVVLSTKLLKIGEYPS